MSEFSLASFVVLDAGIAAGVVLASLGFTYTIGRYSIVPMIAALSLGAAFTALAPYEGSIPGIATWPVYQQHIFVFVVLTLLAYWIFRRHAYFEPSVEPTRFEALCCGVCIAGFSLTVIGAQLPDDILLTISPQLRIIFGDPLPRVLWLLSPIILFGVMRRR